MLTEQSHNGITIYFADAELNRFGYSAEVKRVVSIYDEIGPTNWRLLLIDDDETMDWQLQPIIPDKVLSFASFPVKWMPHVVAFCNKTPDWSPKMKTQTVNYVTLEQIFDGMADALDDFLNNDLDVSFGGINRHTLVTKQYILHEAVHTLEPTDYQILTQKLNDLPENVLIDMETTK